MDRKEIVQEKEDKIITQQSCALNTNIMILACSGCANVGQLSNQAAVELTREGFGKMSCLAGIGGRLGGFIQSAKDTPEMVVIDGCSVGCARAVLEHTEIPLKNYLVVTDLGIKKNKDFNLKDEDIRKVKDAARACCKGNPVPGSGEKTVFNSCCG